tara:strand:- start:163 stop:438 length:276 start_codon:yes stop_codon:yes gene_type:complete
MNVFVDEVTKLLEKKYQPSEGEAVSECPQCRLNDEEIKSLRVSVVRNEATIVDLEERIEKVEGERDDARASLVKMRDALNDINDKSLDALR